MTDLAFGAAITGRPWIVDPDSYAYVDLGWTGLFVETLDWIGDLMA